MFVRPTPFILHQSALFCLQSAFPFTSCYILKFCREEISRSPFQRSSKCWVSIYSQNKRSPPLPKKKKRERENTFETWLEILSLHQPKNWYFAFLRLPCSSLFTHTGVCFTAVTYIYLAIGFLVRYIVLSSVCVCWTAKTRTLVQKNDWLKAAYSFYCLDTKFRHAKMFWLPSLKINALISQGSLAFLFKLKPFLSALSETKEVFFPIYWPSWLRRYQITGV